MLIKQTDMTKGLCEICSHLKFLTAKLGICSTPCIVLRAIVNVLVLISVVTMHNLGKPREYCSVIPLTGNKTRCLATLVLWTSSTYVYLTAVSQHPLELQELVSPIPWGRKSLSCLSKGFVLSGMQLSDVGV